MILEKVQFIEEEEILWVWAKRFWETTYTGLGRFSFVFLFVLVQGIKPCTSCTLDKCSPPSTLSSYRTRFIKCFFKYIMCKCRNSESSEITKFHVNIRYKLGVWVRFSLLLLWCFGGCHRQSPIQATISRMWPGHMGSETAQDFLGETEVEPHRKLVSCRNAHDTVRVSQDAVTKHQR
jgi:hypothetical protein